jgi:hypothetical protein
MEDKFIADPKKDLKEKLENLSNQVRYFDPCIKTDGFQILVTPAWGRCVRIAITSGNRSEDAMLASDLILVFNNMEMVEKLIDDLQKAKNEITNRQAI